MPKKKRNETVDDTIKCKDGFIYIFQEQAYMTEALFKSMAFKTK
jgi:hypothetical protein